MDALDALINSCIPIQAEYLHLMSDSDRSAATIIFSQANSLQLVALHNLIITRFKFMRDVIAMKKGIQGEKHNMTDADWDALTLMVGNKYPNEATRTSVMYSQLKTNFSRLEHYVALFTFAPNFPLVVMSNPSLLGSKGIDALSPTNLLKSAYSYLTHLKAANAKLKGPCRAKFALLFGEKTTLSF
jgi:hypothetical protein